MTESQGRARVKALLKSELKKRGVTYKQLAEMLKEYGIKETDKNIANKIARGGFSAVFLVQCLSVVGCRALSLEA